MKILFLLLLSFNALASSFNVTQSPLGLTASSDANWKTRASQVINANGLVMLELYGNSSKANGLYIDVTTDMVCEIRFLRNNVVLNQGAIIFTELSQLPLGITAKDIFVGQATYSVQVRKLVGRGKCFLSGGLKAIYEN